MTTHDVLCRAKSYLLKHGWHQGSLGCGDRRCLVGAVREGAGAGDQWNYDALQAYAALRRQLHREPAYFNDAPGRTFGQVIAVLDRAILATAPAETPEPVKETVPA